MSASLFVAPLAGGALIGAAATLLLLSLGQTAGVSGIVAGALDLRQAVSWRGWFLAGLVFAGALSALLAPSAFGASPASTPTSLVVAGLLVGFGSRLGRGCTSGHGICGLSRLSIRSLVATVTFMTAGAVTVLAARGGIGGAP
jgi:uncharacterized membrane protein YedE/YeeE